MISYQVSFLNPHNHLFNVQLRIKTPDPSGQKFSLPNWIPGSYMIRDFSRNIVSMKASCDSKELRIDKLSKSAWQVEACNQNLLVEYDVYALDLSVRSAHLDNTHAFFNGTSLFLEPEGFSGHPVALSIIEPLSNRQWGWTVKTALSRQQVNAQGFGEYLALDYDELVDCPVEISCSTNISFIVMGITHYMHLTGDQLEGVDGQRLEKDLSRICNEHAALFNGSLPIKEYRFLTMVVEKGYGGLEHKSSTALVCAPGDLPRVTDQEQTANYRKFLGLCSHEYFHLWNVKRIRPLQFQQNGLTAEVHTTLLWAFEGITSYYDDLGLLRSDCIKLQDYLQLLAETLTRLYRSEGRFKQSLADSSFDAWTKFYKQDENAPNAIVSYYTKGAVVALGLDVTMRQKTGNRVSLDDLMRQLWVDFGQPETGLGEQQIEQLAEQLVGHSMKGFFDLCLRSTQELPVADWLASLGIGMRLRREKSATDQGGFVKPADLSDENDKQNELTLGCRLHQGSTEILHVYNDSAAERSGLCPGDILVALDQKKISSSNFDDVVNGLLPGKLVLVHLFRRDCLHEYQVLPTEKKKNVCELFLLDQTVMNEQQLDMQASWQASNQKQ